MFFLGPLVAYAAMLSDGGNGWSPLVSLLFGIVAALAAEQWACRGRRRSRRWARRGASLVAIAAVSFAAAPYSIRINPAETFADLFGVPPPAGVSHLRGWKQWFDGEDHVLVFDADEATIAAIVAAPARGFTEQPDREQVITTNSTEEDQRIRFLVQPPFFDFGRVGLGPMRGARVWTAAHSWQPTGFSVAHTDTTLLWNPATRQAIVRHLWS